MNNPRRSAWTPGNGPALTVSIAVLALLACAGEPPFDPAAVPGAGLLGMEALVSARIEAARRAVLAAPDSAAAWGALGMDLHAHALHAEAATAYEAAAQRDRRDHRWPYLAAICLEGTDLEAALVQFARAAAVGSPGAAFHVHHADALAEHGDLQAAAAAYETALAEDPNLTHALHGRARLALQAGDVEEAGTLLQRAAEVAPHHGEIHTLLAQVQQRQGDTEGAALSALRARAAGTESEVFEPLLQKVEQRAVSSRCQTRRGLILARQGDYAAAERAFRAVLAARAGNARDLANLGAALAHQGKLEEALAQYKEALQADSSEPFVHNNLAMALAQGGDEVGAFSHLEEAVRLDPGYADAWFNLGLMRQSAQDTGGARQAYEKALEAEPAHSGALTNLGKLLATEGDALAAAQAWLKAAAIDPLNIDARYNLALLDIGLGRHAKAIAGLRAALEHAPNSSLLARTLAWELATVPHNDLRHGGEAVALASRVQASYEGDPEAGDILAAALAETGEFKRAEEIATAAAAAALAAGRGQLAVAIRQRLDGYRKHMPYRQPER